MSNIVNLPPNSESGLYKAPSHEEGGVQVIVDGVTKVEVEGGEIQLCKASMQSEEIHEFKGVTNKELLDELFKVNKCIFEQGKAHSGDFIICKLVVNDEKKRNITGTVKEIVNILQDEKSCNVTEDVADRVNREGGVLTAEDEANVRLDFLKRMQRKKPSKETATKIRVLTKMIGSGHYKNGGAVKKKELNIDYVPDLIAVHNLNYSNLLFADKLGGISMPSLAIIRIDNPLTDYGDITLVAPKSFIDPEENSSARVFNRDVYSPTYPKVYSHVDKSALSKLEADFYQKKRDWTIYADEATRYDLAYFIEDLSNGKHLPDVLDNSVSNSFIVYLWAKENNIELEIPIENYDFRYWTYNPDTDSAFMLSLNEKYPVLWNAVTKDVYDFGNEELEKELAAAFRENYMEYNVGKLEDGDLKDAKIQILENFFEDGELQTTHSYGAFKNLVLAATEKKKVNTSIWRERVKTISDDNTHAIRDFVKSMIDKVMWGSYFFRTKSTKLETSLSNIYDYMGSKAVKSSEETLVHGLGKAASMGAKEYDSLVAVARDKNNFLVSTEAFNEYKKKQDVLWNNVTSKIRQYYKYGNDNISFQALDLLSKSIGQISQYKNPSDEKISQILSKNDYGKTPSYLYDVIREFTECLKNAPTEYFEVKMTSIVKIESFIGAIVPKELVEDVTPLLHKHGIKNISVYNKDDYENRNRFISDAIREVVANSKETILFRKGGNVTDEPTNDINKFEVISFLDKQIQKDKKEYKGDVPTKYNKGDKWNDESWYIDEIIQFIKKSNSSYVFNKFGNKYDYTLLNDLLKNNFPNEYNAAEGIISDKMRDGGGVNDDCKDSISLMKRASEAISNYRHDVDSFAVTSSLENDLDNQVDKLKKGFEDNKMRDGGSLSVKQTINLLQNDLNNIFIKNGFNDIHLIWESQTNRKNQGQLQLITPKEHISKISLRGNEEETDYIKKWRKCVEEIDKLLETKFKIVYKVMGKYFRTVELKTVSEDNGNRVSFELAKLLKIKNFHKPTNAFYDESSGSCSLDTFNKYGKTPPTSDYNAYPNNPTARPFHKYGCSAPTLDVVIDWVKEKYDVSVESEKEIFDVLSASVESKYSKNNAIFLDKAIKFFNKNDNTLAERYFKIIKQAVIVDYTTNDGYNKNINNMLYEFISSNKNINYNEAFLKLYDVNSDFRGIIELRFAEDRGDLIKKVFED